MLTVKQVLESRFPDISEKPWLFKSASFFLKYLLKEKEINEFSLSYPHLQGLDFVEQILEYFNFSYSVRDTEKEHIPYHGRLVIIANHPIGSLDALALIKLISEVRRDIKVVANNMLMTINPLHPILLPIKDKLGKAGKNQLENIYKHLENEGVLIIFPAGEVSRLKPNGIRDNRWHSGFLRIATAIKAPILPIFIDGKNSPLFYTVSILYKPLSTLLLVREMFKQRTKHLPIRVGELITYDSYSNTSNFPPYQRIKLFKKHLYRIEKNRPAIFKTQKAIAPAENRRELTQAIRICEYLGDTDDNKAIYLYQHNESSPILREIGRLREIAFREVGEGSNKRRDIDRYDNDYYHLILWDKDELEIIGAYRFGDAKKLTQQENKLYSATLFNYGDAMEVYFDKGLELGRSFIQPKYWGKRSLDYLWVGLGAFLKSRPEYRYVFGPVTLSDTLPETAKALLFYFYQTYFGSKEKIAEAKVAYRPTTTINNPFKGNDYKNEFIELKSILNNLGVAVPTLYKQYTELYENGGVQFLDFCIDSSFNNCVDGLVLADLSLMKEKKKRRYFDYLK